MKWRITHMEKVRNGYFILDPLYNWVSYCYNQVVAYGRTKKECIKNTRMKGYSVPRGM